MKKLLGIVVLGLLLSGCADPNQSSIMKDMKQDSYEKSSKVQKKVPKYMIMPERELCIYYINFVFTFSFVNGDSPFAFIIRFPFFILYEASTS